MKELRQNWKNDPEGRSAAAKAAKRALKSMVSETIFNNFVGKYEQHG